MVFPRPARLTRREPRGSVSRNVRVNEYFVTSGGREGVDVTAPILISVVDWQARAPRGLTFGFRPVAWIGKPEPLVG